MAETATATAVDPKATAANIAKGITDKAAGKAPPAPAVDPKTGKPAEAVVADPNAGKEKYVVEGKEY